MDIPYQVVGELDVLHGEGSHRFERHRHHAVHLLLDLKDADFPDKQTVNSAHEWEIW
jgi:hypothetical protein